MGRGLRLLFGYGGADELLGGEGNDYLDGGDDNDTLSGGAGNDIYLLRDAGDTLVENLDEGRDTVISYLTGSTTLGANFEVLKLHNSAGISAGYGNGLNNTLRGNASANYLSGGVGKDRLFGGDGLDALNGGTGNDFLDGGAGADAFYFAIGDGDDVIANFEHGIDGIVFSALTFGDLTIGAYNTGMLIEYGGSYSIYLDGVGVIALAAGDFTFV